MIIGIHPASVEGDFTLPVFNFFRELKQQRCNGWSFVRVETLLCEEIGTSYPSSARVFTGIHAAENSNRQVYTVQIVGTGELIDLGRF